MMTSLDARHARLVRTGLLVSVLALTLTGCTSIRKAMDPGNVEYRGATSGPGLDIPPDLITPQGADQYSVPSSRNTRAQTLSDFNRAKATQDAAPRDTTVMPERAAARIERDGRSRWIVVNEPPEVLWPQLRDFWVSQGFNLVTDEPNLGIMETEWAERRQRVETSGVRGVLSRVMGSSYATGERDRYRTRIDRLPDGRTELTITHRGMEEVLVGTMKDSSMWQPRPNDPELEVEYLRRMLTMLGRAPVATASAAGSSAGSGAGGTGGADGSAAAPAAGTTAVPAMAARSRIVSEGAQTSIILDESFDRAWREVGLVLDRVGFTVEDRDRSKGVYFVRYVDLDRRDPSQGALSRFFSGERKDLAGQRYQIVVASNGQNAANIGVLDTQGAVPEAEENRRVANRIVSLLNDELK